MLNKVTLIGNLGKDPEIRTTKNGKEIANFSLATSESYKDANGEKQVKTQWHRVSVFGGLVNIVKNYVHKGTKLYLEGSMEYGEYEKDGHKVYTATVILSGFNSKLDLLGGKTSNGIKQEPQNDAATWEQVEDNLVDDDIPF